MTYIDGIVRPYNSLESPTILLYVIYSKEVT